MKPPRVLDCVRRSTCSERPVRRVSLPSYKSELGYPQHGCMVRPDDLTDPFLAIPLPEGINQKTTWACNRLITP